MKLVFAMHRDWITDQKKEKNKIMVVCNPTLRSREEVISRNMLFHLILCSLVLCVCVCYLIFTLSGLNNNQV